MTKSRKIFLLVLSCCTLWACNGFAKSPTLPETKKTQVVIIGTLHKQHYENPKYSPEVLKAIILSLKPDAILNELPLSGVDPNGRPLAMLRIKNEHGGPESWAADTVAMQLGIKQIPFDQPDRQEIFKKTHYFEREKISNELFDKWSNQLFTKDPNSNDVKIIELFIYAMRAQSNLDHKAGPEIINSEIYDSIIRMKHSLWHDILPEIIKKYPGYEKFADDQNFFKEHWNQRNRTMADNIIKAAEKYKGKRLFVITGDEHRYILKDLLEDEKSIELKEYWEILKPDIQTGGDKKS